MKQSALESQSVASSHSVDSESSAEEAIESSKQETQKMVFDQVETKYIQNEVSADARRQKRLEAEKACEMIEAGKCLSDTDEDFM